MNHEDALLMQVSKTFKKAFENLNDFKSPKLAVNNHISRLRQRRCLRFDMLKLI